MSPDSDVARHARDVERDNYGRAVRTDIDMEHRLGVEHVRFVTRPALFCASCGAAVMQHVFGPIRREVWCAEQSCEQHGKRLNVFDRIVDGVPHA